MKKLLLALATLLAIPGLAYAGDPVDCGTSCPEGQVLVSFTDGNNVTCSCEIQADMDSTIADPNVHEGTVTTDAGAPQITGDE